MPAFSLPTTGIFLVTVAAVTVLFVLGVRSAAGGAAAAVGAGGGAVFRSPPRNRIIP